MTADICILHFRIPDHSSTIQPELNEPIEYPTVNVDQNEWECQLSILEDKSTLKAILKSFNLTEANKMKFRSCCSLQIMALDDFDGGSAQVLMTKRIKDDTLFKNGFEYRNDIRINNHYEFYLILSSHSIKLLGSPGTANWTHTLARSESDPAVRSIDPLVELMTLFERHCFTFDVECRFISKDGIVLDRIRAHHCILSIYPAFSEKLTLTQGNPHQRSVITITAPIEAWATFERMIGFIYSGRLPQDGFAPSSEQWRIAFEISREYGLEKSLNSRLWMEWHLTGLQQVITDNNVLDVYFVWGYEHPAVSHICVRHVAQRSQVQFHEGDFGSYVMRKLHCKYQDSAGFHEFQEAIVAELMRVYSGQKNSRCLQPPAANFDE